MKTHTQSQIALAIELSRQGIYVFDNDLKDDI